MEIGYYIGDLLSEQDEVSLPGIGTFFKQRIPGKFIEESNSYTPPSYELSLKVSDDNYPGLADFISKTKNLSITSAEYFVKKFSSNLYDLLQAAGNAEIKPLGVVHKHEEELTFRPFNNIDISGDVFGLRPVVKPVFVKPVEPITPIEPVEQHISPEPEVTEIPFSPTVDPIEATISEEQQAADYLQNPFGFDLSENVQTDNAPEIDNTEPIRRSISPLLIFAIVLAILALTAFLLYRFNPAVQQFLSSKSVAQTESHEPTEQAAQFAFPDTLISDSSQLENPDTTAIVETVTPSPIVTEEPEPEEIAENVTRYEIVVAAFSRKADAEKHIQSLAKKGIEAHIASNLNGPLHKISVGSFTNHREALAEYKRVKEEMEPNASLIPTKK